MIVFNRPYLTGKEIGNITVAFAENKLAGDGYFSKQCHKWLTQHINSQKALITHSGTAALEMIAILLNTIPGDEIIMPSFTFVSMANAFVLRGGIPVFIDIRPDTLNINEDLIEGAITNKTRAIVVVHYAGVACNMSAILKIAKKHNLPVIEDAAHAIGAYYNSIPLGSLGDMGALSFHETKNIISGEGGAILINNSKYIERAEIIREKGTDRSRFINGLIDKYTWQDIGSSYLPSEIIAAFLLAQLQSLDQITNDRIESWNYYYANLQNLEQLDYLRQPIIPNECKHNGHIYYLILQDSINREIVISKLRECGVMSAFHYIPLHSSPAGIKFGKVGSKMEVTDIVAKQIIRLPLYYGIKRDEQNKVIECLTKIITQKI